MLSRFKNFHIGTEGKFLFFNMLTSFFISFFLAHLYSLFVPLSVFLKGYHIHHFYYGIVLLAASGAIGMISNDKIIKIITSFTLGVGLGFVVDELGLLLSCTTDGKVCSYQFPNVFDIVVYMTVVYLMLIFFGDWLAAPFKRIFGLANKNQALEKKNAEENVIFNKMTDEN